MPTQALDLGNEPVENELAMLLVGPNKAGKSRLAATAAGLGPVFFLDYDRRLRALAGFKNVYGMTLSDPSISSIQPTVFNDTITFLTNLEKSRKIKFLNPIFKDLSENIEVTTLVFDSVMTMADAFRNYLLYANRDLRREIVSAGGISIRVSHSWDGWTAEQEAVMQTILRARAIPGLNVVCILHEVPEEAPSSTPEKPVYTGKVEVYPRRYNKILTYFNEVWRVNRDNGGLPIVTIQPDGVFTKAATNLTLDLTKKKFDPDIAKIVALARSHGTSQAAMSKG